MGSQVDYVGAGTTVAGDVFSFSVPYPSGIDGDSWLVLLVWNKLGQTDGYEQNLAAGWFTDWDEVYVAGASGAQGLFIVAAKRADGTESGNYATPGFSVQREGGAVMLAFQPDGDDGLVTIIDPGVVSALEPSDDTDLDGRLPVGSERISFYVELPAFTPDRNNGTAIAVVGVGDDQSLIDSVNPDEPFERFPDVGDGETATPPTVGRITTTAGSDAGFGWLVDLDPVSATAYASELKTDTLDIGGNDINQGIIVVVNANPDPDITGIAPDIVVDVDLEATATAFDPDVTVGPVDVDAGVGLDVDSLTSIIPNARKPRREVIWLYGVDGVKRGALGP